MKLALIGSRSYNDYDVFSQVLMPYVSSITLVISGGAKGADALAKRWAIEHGLPIQEILPDWKAFGRGAGIKRNEIIVNNADAVIAFWNTQSKGTKHVIDFCLKQNKKIIVIEVKNEPE